MYGHGSAQYAIRPEQRQLRLVVGGQQAAAALQQAVLLPQVAELVLVCRSWDHRKEIVGNISCFIMYIEKSTEILMWCQKHHFRAQLENRG